MGSPRCRPGLGGDGDLTRLADRGHELIAPRLLREEVANALLMGVRRGRWAGVEADRGYERLRLLPVRFVDDLRDVDRAWDLSRRYDNHPVHDMLYVAVAERTRSMFVTADERLRDQLAGLPWVVGPARLVANSEHGTTRENLRSRPPGSRGPLGHPGGP